MNDKVDKVSVYISYCDKEFYSEAKLGTLTLAQTLDLQKQLRQISPLKMQCPNYLNAHFEYANEIGRGFVRRLSPTLQYRINATFMYKYDKAECCKKYLLRNANQMTRMCAHNLKNGKCQDPLIRQTIGAILFPKLYAKDNQK